MTTAPGSTQPRLLIVDDDELILSLLIEELSDDYDVIGARQRSDVPQALRQLGAEPTCALVDLGLPPHADGPREGLALVRELVATVPACAIIVMSGQSEEEHGKVARTLGAFDFVAKPCDADTIRTVLHRARSFHTNDSDPSGLLGSSASLARLLRQLRQFGPAPYPVLVEGESGTGKELAARALHRESGLPGNFVALNCAAMPEQLFEASLFGARRGSYTGATADMPGHLEAAREGTLLLDEIGDLPPILQPKLLRLLENDEYLRLGDSQPRHADVRIVAATNRSLREAVRHGAFRQDLYHRLSVLVVTTPPLRELGDDCMVLLEHFRAQAAATAGTQPFSLDAEATSTWRNYRFPGNVRELRNIVFRLQVTQPSTAVTATTLVAELLAPLPSATGNLEHLLETDARAHARAALNSTGSRARAASRLGIHPDRLEQLLDDPPASLPGE